MKQNRYSQRDILAHGIVVCGVFFGAASFFVAPAMQDRDAANAELIAITNQQSQARAGEAVAKSAAKMLKRAERYERAITDRSAASSDELALYEAYRAMSEDLGIEIVRFDPRPITGNASSRSKKGTDEPRVSQQFGAAVRIDASGSLEDIIELIDRVSTQAGFVRVRSARITPNEEFGDGGVTLGLECEHYSFRVPEPNELTDQTDETDGSGA